MAEPGSPAAAKWGDLGVRAVSALVLIPLVLAGVWAGGIWFEEFVALLAILMAYEWCKLTMATAPCNLPSMPRQGWLAP